MLRYFLDINYRGTQYHGWQQQPHIVTIQGVLQTCLSQILKRDIQIVGSSRTDKGVHAQQQFAHVDLGGDVVVERLRYQLNAVLPPDIAIRAIHPVTPTAHARFSAVDRTYVYSMMPQKSPFSYETSYFFRGKLDMNSMNEAAVMLCQRRDFRNVCKRRPDDVHWLCTLKEAQWSTHEGGLRFRIKANRFLRSMVRAIVALMVKIGRGKMSLEDFQRLIDREEYDGLLGLVPAHGLTLTQVTYSRDVFLT